jgi:hypothetical protein
MPLSGDPQLSNPTRPCLRRFVPGRAGRYHGDEGSAQEGVRGLLRHILLLFMSFVLPRLCALCSNRINKTQIKNIAYQLYQDRGGTDPTAFFNEMELKHGNPTDFENYCMRRRHADLHHFHYELGRLLA